MLLYIDTSDSQKTIVGLDQEKIEKPTSKDKSQQVLGLIHETLKKKHISIHSIDEIAVNLGPGSFTGLKVGVSIANILGWALNIPVNRKNINLEGPQLPKYE